MAEYGPRKRAFFDRFLTLANGVSPHDTFDRVFCPLDPDAFAARFGRWMAACEGAERATDLAVGVRQIPPTGGLTSRRSPHCERP